MNTQEYNKLFYQFLLDKKFIILQKYNSFATSRYYAVKEDKYESNYNFSKASSFDYFKDLTTIFFKDNNDNCSLDFFIECFKSANKEDKVFLVKNINFVESWENKLYLFLDIIETEKLIPFILSLPISIFDLSSINVNELDMYLEKRLIDKKTIDSFFVSFLKNRKNQLKPTKKSNEIKIFLTNKYNKEKELLKHYFAFFNAIKNEFCEIDLNILENTFTHSVVTRINCRKASQLLCIPNYTDEKIHSEITTFISSAKEYYKFEFCNIYMIDNHKKITEVIIHSNQQINQEVINKDIKDFLLFKKDNINFISNRQNITKWFLEKELKNELNNLNKDIRKTKI